MPKPSPLAGLLTARELGQLADLPGQRGPLTTNGIKRWERNGCPVAVRGRAGKASLFDEKAVRAWLEAREARGRVRGPGAPPLPANKGGGASATLLGGDVLHGHGRAATDADPITDFAFERARKERAQAQLAEQTYRARERELLPRHEVEKAWGAERDAIRTSLLAVPQSHADRVFRAGTLEGVLGVERALKVAIYEVLRELAGVVEGEGAGSSAGEDEDDADDELDADDDDE